jgi:hypothetical protein
MNKIKPEKHGKLPLSWLKKCKKIMGRTIHSPSCYTWQTSASFLIRPSPPTPPTSTHRR